MSEQCVQNETFEMKCTNDELIEQYINLYSLERITENDIYITKEKHLESKGLDLIFPNDIIIPRESRVLVDMNVIVISKNNHSSITSPFFLVLRSSAHHYPLLLSNHIGIFDATYRGSVKVSLHNIVREVSQYSQYVGYNDKFFVRNEDGALIIKAGTRLIQLLPNLSNSTSFQLVTDFQEDMKTTLRGTGGFGSTGVNVLEGNHI